MSINCKPSSKLYNKKSKVKISRVWIIYSISLVIFIFLKFQLQQYNNAFVITERINLNYYKWDKHKHI